MSADLDFALSLADEADALALARFRASDLRVETKPDLTPVSEADRAIEERLRVRVAAERPGERVVGEEFGADDGDGPRWILDPIDATKNYVRGIPIFATLIALEDRVAVVSAPALGRRWWAVRGEGAWCDGAGGERRLQVSGVERIEDAVLTYTSLSGWDGRFHALARGPGRRAASATSGSTCCWRRAPWTSAWIRWRTSGICRAQADHRGGRRPSHRSGGRSPGRRRQRRRLQRPAARGGAGGARPITAGHLAGTTAGVATPSSKIASVGSLIGHTSLYPR